jgi:uncharacterized protein (UPF0333 family)
MKKLLSVVVIAVVMASSSLAYCAGQQAHFDARAAANNAANMTANLVVLTVEMVGTALTWPFRLVNAGGVEVNNGIFADKKKCYYCEIGEEHPDNYECPRMASE